MGIYETRKSLGQRLQRARLRNKDFTLISNDCWGAEVYKYFNLPWNTPFIGLFFMAEDYLRLVANLRHYMGSELIFVQESRHAVVNAMRVRNPYPIGLLGGEVEIQFLHYHSEQEAREKWARRTARMNWDRLVFKFDASKDQATVEQAQQFDKLPYKRLILLKQPIPGLNFGLVIPNYSPDGLKQFNAAMPEFDLVHWLNTGQVRRSALYGLTNKILVLEN
jgi:uncharacterized protein (DUF1919 family)